MRGDSPSAQAAVVVDDTDVCNLTEAGEDAGELVCGDLVDQVANIEGLAGRGRSAVVAVGTGAGAGATGLFLGDGLDGVGADSGRLVGRVGGGGVVGRGRGRGRRQAVLERRLCGCLGKVVGCLCCVIRGKAALQGSEDGLLLASAGGGGDCGDGARRGDEGLGGSSAEGAGGGAAEEKPGGQGSERAGGGCECSRATYMMMVGGNGVRVRVE